MSGVWCVDCGCDMADHNADDTCTCGDCCHPLFRPHDDTTPASVPTPTTGARDE